MDNFCKNWGATIEKTIYPYSAFASIEEIEAQIEFPTTKMFFNELRQSEIDETDYNKAKDEYERRRSLPETDPNHISNFKGWLKYYNECDVMPLVEALSKCFDKFYEYFKVDPLINLSLPSLAFK